MNLQRTQEMNIKSLIDKVLENWPAKVVCFAIAFLLFIFYRMSTIEQRFFSVPLAIENAEDFVPSAAYSHTVKITLRGETDNIYPVGEKDIVAFLDFSKISREGDFHIPVQTRLKGIPEGSAMLEVAVEPSEILIHAEHRVSKKVPIDPVFRGEPEAGYEFSGYTIQPSVVEISGPRSVVEKTATAKTETIELSGVNSSYNASAILVDVNPLVTILGSRKVVLDVSISEKILIRQFTEVPLFFENLDSSLQADAGATSGSLTLKGSESFLAEWALPANALTVFCENIGSPGVYSLPVHAIVPGKFEIVENLPSEIQFTVTRKAP